MSESDARMVMNLLFSVLGMLALLLVLAVGILRRLKRIGLRLMELQQSRQGGESAPVAADIAAGGAFEMFLSEDAVRRELPKSEQFAEYRKWRQERGMNWSNS
jgi:hypothetical protein